MKRDILERTATTCCTLQALQAVIFSNRNYN